MTEGGNVVVSIVFQKGDRADGGLESITQLIEHRSRKLAVGERQIVITQSKSSFTRRWQKAGARVFIWKLPNLSRQEFWTWSILLMIKRVYALFYFNYLTFNQLKKYSSTVIHCHEALGFFHSIVAAKLAKARVIFSLRDTIEEKRIKGLRWKLIFIGSDFIVVLSRDMKERLINVFPQGSFIRNKLTQKIRQIYSVVPQTFVPLKRITQLSIRSELGVDNCKFAIGCIGAFRDQKNQQTFLERVIKPLSDEFKEFQFYFIGDCDESNNKQAARCKKLVSELALENVVKFKGFKKDILSWYRALDLVTIPSKHEGLSRSMIEGLACGTPIISFDVCSAREILEQFCCGVVVSQGDYEAFRNALIDLYFDEARRYRYRLNGIRISRVLFEPGSILKDYEALYQARFLEEITEDLQIAYGS